jgi:hypothetical protein
MAQPPKSTGFYYINAFVLLWSSSNSLLYLCRHCRLSHIGPYILWRIFLLKMLGILSSFFFFFQVSAVYVSFGLTSVLYLRIFVFLESRCNLSWLFSPSYDLLAAIRQFVIPSETLLSPFTNEPRYVEVYIYKEPTWCNLAVCLLLTAIILYMFRTLFASILRRT